MDISRLSDYPRICEVIGLMSELLTKEYPEIKTVEVTISDDSCDSNTGCASLPGKAVCFPSAFENKPFIEILRAMGLVFIYKALNLGKIEEAPKTNEIISIIENAMHTILLDRCEFCGTELSSESRTCYSCGNIKGNNWRCSH